MPTVCVKAFSLPVFDEREILRYAGVKGEASAEVLALLRECEGEAAAAICGAVCYAEFPCTVAAEMLDLGFAQTSSRDLSRALGGCHGVLVFAATVGLGIDRLIRKYAHLSPARSVMLQAIGTERVEALCDVFCAEQAAEYEKKGLKLGRRFSPGYGDLPLALQTELFAALNCSKQIGISLGDSLLMTPQKSVTAIVGIANK